MINKVIIFGDVFSAKATSWYRTAGAVPATPVSPLNSLLSALVNGISTIAGGGKTMFTQLQQPGVLDPALNQMLTNQNASAITGIPKAGLYWVLLDNQLKYITGGFDFVGSNEELKNNALLNISIPKNGYLYVYTANQTPNIAVFFDNLQVVHQRSSLLEETHYYPFGLTMKGISDKAAIKVENKYKYNGKELQNKEFSDGSGLELYDYGARFYDQQLGRFFTQDRFSEKYNPVSPYQYGANNPIFFIDKNGDSIGVGNLTEDQSKAMKEFAKTKQGNFFLAQYAKKGQTAFGVTFNKQGKYDKQGINISYQSSGDKERSSTNVEQNTQGGININVSIATEGYGFSNKTLNIVKAATHESFIHADLYTKDWLDNKKLDNSNLSDWTKNGLSREELVKHGHHLESSKLFYQNQGNQTTLWPYQALQLLKVVSSNLGANNSDNKIMGTMWQFNGSYINVNSKTGGVKWDSK